MAPPAEAEWETRNNVIAPDLFTLHSRCIAMRSVSFNVIITVVIG